VTLGLDTSCVLRILTGLPEDQANRMLVWLRAVWESAGRVVVSDLVIAEAYHSLQHFYQIPKEEALRRLGQFLAWENIVPVGTARSVLEAESLARARPGFVDRLIHADYLERGADCWVTFEKAGKRMPRSMVL